ncbi:shTK domain protein [Cooperia oncophora]
MPVCLQRPIASLLSVPGVTCSSITQAQCKDPKWREIIARDCFFFLFFYLFFVFPQSEAIWMTVKISGGCVDAAIECANDKSICRNIDMQAFTMANCKKTCGYCENSSSTSPGGYTGGYTNSPGTCVDNSSR